MAATRACRRLIICITLLFPTVAAAQERPIVELAAGAGFVFGGGSEDPGPSLPSYDIGVVLWPFARWGLAGRLVRAPGEDLYPNPLPSGDRTFLGREKLSYYTVGARYRRFPAPSHEMNLGFGLMVGGEFRTIVLFHQLAGPPIRRSHPDTFFNGFYVEGLWGWQLSRHFGVKGGLTFDFNVETNNLQPVALAVISF